MNSYIMHKTTLVSHRSLLLLHKPLLAAKIFSEGNTAPNHLPDNCGNTNFLIPRVVYL